MMKKVLGVKLFGLPVVSILISAFVLLAFTWMWWGSIFKDLWQPMWSWSKQTDTKN